MTPSRRHPHVSFHSAAFGGLLLSFTSMGCNSLQYADTFVPEGDVTQVVVRSDSGMVSLVRGDTLRVEREVHAREQVLSLSHEVRDGVLYLNAACTTILPCPVNTVISLPDDIPVEVELGSGQLLASSTGALTARVGRGAIAADVTGPLRLQLGSGDVRATVVDGHDVRVAVGDGNVVLGVSAGTYEVDVTAAHLRVAGIDPLEGSEAGSDVPRLTVVAPSGAVNVVGRQSLASR